MRVTYGHRLLRRFLRRKGYVLVYEDRWRRREALERSLSFYQDAERVAYQTLDDEVQRRYALENEKLKVEARLAAAHEVIKEYEMQRVKR